MLNKQTANLFHALKTLRQQVAKKIITMEVYEARMNKIFQIANECAAPSRKFK